MPARFCVQLFFFYNGKLASCSFISLAGFDSLLSRGKHPNVWTGAGTGGFRSKFRFSVGELLEGFFL